LSRLDLMHYLLLKNSSSIMFENFKFCIVGKNIIDMLFFIASTRNSLSKALNKSTFIYL
jgi:hypothetical protein